MCVCYWCPLLIRVWCRVLRCGVSTCAARQGCEFYKTSEENGIFVHPVVQTDVVKKQ